MEKFCLQSWVLHRIHYFSSYTSVGDINSETTKNTKNIQALFFTLHYDFFFFKQKTKDKTPTKFPSLSFPSQRGNWDKEGQSDLVRWQKVSGKALFPIHSYIRTFLQVLVGQEGDRLFKERFRTPSSPLIRETVQEPNVFLTKEDCSKDPEGFLPRLSFPSISVAFGTETLLQTLSTNLPTSKKQCISQIPYGNTILPRHGNFFPVMT